MADSADIACRRATRLLSLACERKLDEHEVQILQRHLDACLMCRNFSTQLDFLRNASRRFARGE
jgi:predicted anti-sigma-YlaC factor YlaD